MIKTFLVRCMGEVDATGFAIEYEMFIKWQ